MRVSNLTAEESRASRHLTIVKLRGKRFFARRGLEEKRRRRRSRQADKLTPRSTALLSSFGSSLVRVREKSSPRERSEYVRLFPNRDLEKPNEQACEKKTTRNERQTTQASARENERDERERDGYKGRQVLASEREGETWMSWLVTVTTVRAGRATSEKGEEAKEKRS